MTPHPRHKPWLLQARLTLVMLLVWGFHPWALTAAAEPTSKPLWEIGLTGAGAWVPDYPAADEYHAVGLALPYAVYRGPIFRAGDGSIARGRFFRHPRFEFDLSLSGSFPADSDHNDARRGMPNLDLLLEAGPRLSIRLADLTPTSNLRLRLAVRTVASVDLSHLRYRGFVFAPRLVYTHTNLFDTKMRFTARLGPFFATTRFMDYFYEVDPRFVTPDRPAFNAKGGYLGSKLTLSAALPLTERVKAFAALQAGYYAGATNEDSPLFRDDVNVGVGLGLIWSIWQSKKPAAE